MVDDKAKITLSYKGEYLSLEYAKISDLDNQPQFGLRYIGLTLYNSIRTEHFAIEKLNYESISK